MLKLCAKFQKGLCRFEEISIKVVGGKNEAKQLFFLPAENNFWKNKSTMHFCTKVQAYTMVRSRDMCK